MSNKPYSGKFTKLKNPRKYVGDVNNLVYRSLWEKNAFIWCDECPDIVEWASEEVVIPYVKPTTGKRARYFPDLYIKFKSGAQHIIEIKPDNQTRLPEEPKRKTKRYMNEVATYAVNAEKWKAAQGVAERNNLIFEVWTEHTLNSLGIATSATPTEKKFKARGKKPAMKNIRKPTRKS